MYADYLDDYDQFPDDASVGRPMSDISMNDAQSSGSFNSPAPSVYSFHSSVDGHMLRDLHGRVLNNQSEIYMLPADGEEHERLDIQHEMLRVSLGSLYVAEDHVKRALAPRNDGRPAILDVGSGSGRWAIDMAIEFPHCDVVGVDLAPTTIPAHAIPPNCRFECDDANLGFIHYRGCFDVVHGRAIASGIKDFDGFIDDMAQVLRPGGVLILMPGDLQLFNPKREPAAVVEVGEPGYSWLQKLFLASYSAMKERTPMIDAPILIPRYLATHEAFENHGDNALFIALGAWINGTPAETYAASLLGLDAIGLVQSMVPLLLADGYFQETVDHMVKESIREIRELRVQFYVRWHYFWVTRKADWQPPPFESMHEKHYIPTEDDRY